MVLSIQDRNQNIEIRQCAEQNGTMWCNSICRQTLLLNADMLKFSKIMRIFSRMHFQIKMLNLLEKFIAVHVFLTKIDTNICKALKFKKDKEIFSKTFSNLFLHLNYLLISILCLCFTKLFNFLTFPACF